MTEPLSPTELANRIDAVDYDVWRAWHTAEQPPLVFTFRFENSPAADFPWTDVSIFSAWTDARRVTVRDALAIYETFLNIDFVEDNSAADADFSFYLASSGLSGGRGRFRWSGSEWDGHAVYNAALSLGETDLDLVVHEIGHTLGLKHTGNYDVGGNLPPGPFLPGDEDNTRFSIMSYNDATGLAEVRAPALYDIAALQARFGANLDHATGNDTYRVPASFTLQTLWDAGGTDTITARGMSAAARIDLRAGTFSTFGNGAEIAIAYGVTIENATGTGHSDTLTGNGASNRLKGFGGRDIIEAGAGEDFVFGGGGNDRLLGGAGNDRIQDGNGRDFVNGQNGNDRFFAQSGSDTLIGGKGKDSYIARGERADFLLTDLGNDRWSIYDGRFTDTLIGIEKVIFIDEVFLL